MGVDIRLRASPLLSTLARVVPTSSHLWSKDSEDPGEVEARLEQYL